MLPQKRRNVYHISKCKCPGLVRVCHTKIVFTNTRVPIKNLFDYLKAGHPLNDFLEDFPSVTKEQAVQVLTHFENLLNFHSKEYA